MNIMPNKSRTDSPLGTLGMRELFIYFHNMHCIIYVYIVYSIYSIASIAWLFSIFYIKVFFKFFIFFRVFLPWYFCILYLQIMLLISKIC
jgi:hypothetical protein